MTASVLVVDDSALMRKVLKRILVEAGGFEVFTARNGLDALDQVQRIQPDVVTMDINMPGMDGLSCLTRIMHDDPRPVVVVSSLSEHGALVTLEALELGAVDYVPKPGGTVSLNMDQVAVELIAKVRGAVGAKVGRAGGLAARMRADRHRAGGAEATQRRRRSPSQVTSTPVDVVLIGSSTGGPAVLSMLLSALPGSLSAPVVVAQHIPASFTASLANRLNEACELGVHEVSRSQRLEPGHVYIGRGDADVVLARQGDELIAKSVPSSLNYSWHPSVNRLVASARHVVDPRRVVAALLTGMGDDGAVELAGLRADGGRTIAEAEETAVIWGMPGELVRRGGATRILPNYRIADQIVDWVH